MLRLQQQAHLDRRQPRMLEAGGALEVVRAGRPGEVVDVLLEVLVGRRPSVFSKRLVSTPVAPSGQWPGTVNATS
jgi:hypothetical protein